MPPKGTRMERWYPVIVTTTDDKGKQVKYTELQPTQPTPEDDTPPAQPIWVAVMRNA